MQLKDELFLFCVRLKLGLFELDLAQRFGLHVSSVSRKITTWANFCTSFLAISQYGQLESALINLCQIASKSSIR